MPKFIEHRRVVASGAAEFVLRSRFYLLWIVGSTTVAFGLGCVIVFFSLGSRSLAIGLQLGFELSCNAVIINAGIDKGCHKFHCLDVPVV